MDIPPRDKLLTLTPRRAVCIEHHDDLVWQRARRETKRVEELGQIWQYIVLEGFGIYAVMLYTKPQRIVEGTQNDETEHSKLLAV